MAKYTVYVMVGIIILVILFGMVFFVDYGKIVPKSSTRSKTGGKVKLMVVNQSEEVG